MCSLGLIWFIFFGHSISVTHHSLIITYHLSLITLKYHVCLAPSLTSHHSIFFTLFVGPIPVTLYNFFFFFLFFWVSCAVLFFFSFCFFFSLDSVSLGTKKKKKKKEKAAPVIGMGSTNSVKNIEWWEVSDGAKQTWYFKWWVMSDELWMISDRNWVTKIK